MKNHICHSTDSLFPEQQHLQYHLLQQLQDLLHHQDVQNNIHSNMSHRVQKVLQAYRGESEKKRNVLKEKKIDINRMNKKQKSTGNEKSNEKNSFSNTKSQQFLRKQLLMLPKYCEQMEGRNERKKQVCRSLSVKSGISTKSKIKQRQKMKCGSKEKKRRRKEKIQMKNMYSDYEQIEDREGKKQFEFMKFMKEKQGEIQIEKLQLEDRIKLLKEAIQSQKMAIQKANMSIKCISHQLNNLQTNSEQVFGRKGCVNKRLGDLWTQVKILKQNYDGTLNQSQVVKNNVKEEKQLILMYKTVIEELKSQLKIEKSERDEKRKELRILKKTEQASKNKFKRVNWKTDGLMDKVKKSMDKWS